MHPGDESGHSGEVRITDRRRFNDAGDVRGHDEPGVGSDVGAAAEQAPAEDRLVAARADRAEPEPGEQVSDRAARAPDAGAPPRNVVLDLGIEAVFFVFYQSALIALGVPEVAGESREPDLVEARQAIEFLRILEAKTAGNLSPEEIETLRQLLDDAQLRYVHVARGMAGGGA